MNYSCLKFYKDNKANLRPEGQVYEVGVRNESFLQSKYYVDSFNMYLSSITIFLC